MISNLSSEQPQTFVPQYLENHSSQSQSYCSAETTKVNLVKHALAFNVEQHLHLLTSSSQIHYSTKCCITAICLTHARLYRSNTGP